MTCSWNVEFCTVTILEYKLQYWHFNWVLCVGQLLTLQHISLPHISLPHISLRHFICKFWTICTIDYCWSTLILGMNIQGEIVRSAY